jgi:hypothetical protein
MTTANEIITEGFGIAQITNPTTAQISSALISLNSLISFIGADFMGYSVTSETLTLTVADSEYTIGDSGNLNTVRPIRIANCRLRDSNSDDWPVTVLAAKDYNDIVTKDYSGRPDAVYFLPEYPLAKIIFNRAPDYAYVAYFEFHKPLTELSTTSTTLTMPPEYKEYFSYNLAVKIAEKWNRNLQKSVYENANRTHEIIERLNAIHQGVPEVKFEYIGRNSGVKPYTNILTDTTG